MDQLICNKAVCVIVYVYILSQAHPPIEAPPIFLLRFHPDLLRLLQ